MLCLWQADIEAANDVVKASLNVCNQHRRRSGFVQQLYRRDGFADELTAGVIVLSALTVLCFHAVFMVLLLLLSLLFLFAIVIIIWNWRNLLCVKIK